MIQLGWKWKKIYELISNNYYIFSIEIRWKQYNIIAETG